MATTRTGADIEAAVARPLTPAQRARVDELLTSPSMRSRLRRDRSQLVTMPIDPTPDTAILEGPEALEAFGFTP